jgi:uncharacterized protein
MRITRRMPELAPGMRILQPQDYRKTAWKNAQGLTTEIAVSPADAGVVGKPFDWRVSIADVEKDCEFSRFPGHDRSIMLIKGAGMELSFDASPFQRIDQAHKFFRFKGESQSHCRLLDGPVRDFNIMSARARCAHTCDVSTSSTSIHWKSDSEVMVIYCLKGGFSLEGLHVKPIQINREQTLILDKSGKYPGVKILKMDPFAKEACMVIVKIHYLH